MQNNYRVALIPGDGIGREVLSEGVKVMEAAAGRFDFEFSWSEFDWSCERFHRVGEIMPTDGLEQLRNFDAIYFGAVGFPGVPDHVSLWNLLIPMRRGLKLYVNLRPVRLLPGMISPLRDRGPGDIDYLIVWACVQRFGFQVLLSSCLGDGSLDLTRSKSTKRV